MLTKKARLFLALAATTPLMFAACRDQKILSAVGDVSGTYNLTVFANQTMPAGFTAAAGQDSELPNGGTVLVNDGTLVLNSDGTFLETNNFMKTATGATTSFPSAFISAGTYSVSGSTISLSAPAQNGFAARAVSGSVSMTTVAYVEGGQFFQYDK
jgi:hypothetical protein